MNWVRNDSIEWVRIDLDKKLWVRNDWVRNERGYETTGSRFLKCQYMLKSRFLSTGRLWFGPNYFST